MSAELIQHIQALKSAIKAKKKEFRVKRGSKFLPKKEQAMEAMEEKHEKGETKEHEESEDDGFKSAKRDFMKRKSSRASDAPSVSIFSKKGGAPKAPPEAPKAPKAPKGMK